MKKLFEEYVESADYKISVFFKELKSQIERWFNEGSLAAQGCEVDGEMEIVNYNPMEKFLIVNFTEPISDDDSEVEGQFFRYRMTFMVRLDEMSGEEGEQDEFDEEGESPEVQSDKSDISKILLKIHQFDEENNEKGELVEEIYVEDIKEDFIIDKVGQLKGKSEEGQEPDDNDLKDNIYIK